jgi:hypothetical protein
MIIVGIDAHSRSHAAAAIDEHGRLLEGIEVGAGARRLAELSAWINALPQPRLIAIENARGYGLAIAQSLLAQGDELVDVPATLTCDGRRSSGQRGKHDQGDALVVARIGLRDQERLPRLDATVLDDELKLLADARDQLIVEAGRRRNRVHALLRVAAPGYQATTGALASAGSVRRARAVARRAAQHDLKGVNICVAAQRQPAGVEPIGLRLPAPTPQRAGTARVDGMNLEAAGLQLARDPPPARRRLDRDRRPLCPPLHRPVIEPLPRRRKPALGKLARVRIEHHHLERRLVDIESCVQHLPGLPSSRKLGREPTAALGGPLHYIPTGRIVAVVRPRRSP